METREVELAGNGSEWVTQEVEALPKGNLLVDVTVTGVAEAAGISFGHYKDFLTPISQDSGEKRLQLELDAGAKTWAFRVDGVLMDRHWTDSAVHSVDDLFDGILAFKARNAGTVTFRDLTVRPLESATLLSVVITCHRFAQRLRVALTSWCRQNLPSGALEVIVVNPASPDATHDLIAGFAGIYPNVRVRELAVHAALAHNKAAMINHGLTASRGEWIWLTDADCVFPRDAASRLLAQLNGIDTLWFCERRHLTKTVTDGLLVGRFDPSDDFDTFADRHGAHVDVEPWGYTQIFHRSHLAWVQYPDGHMAYAYCDTNFVDAWRAAGLRQSQLAGVRCLHLAHPFSWNGTNRLL
jgi:hypothetical protein